MDRVFVTNRRNVPVGAGRSIVRDEPLDLGRVPRIAHLHAVVDRRDVDDADRCAGARRELVDEADIYIVCRVNRHRTGVDLNGVRAGLPCDGWTDLQRVRVIDSRDVADRVLRDGDARAAASAFLTGEKLATNDLQFFKRARDLGLDVEYVGSGAAARRAANYEPRPVRIPAE